MKKKPLYVTYISIQASLVKYFIKTCDIFSYTSFTTKCKQNK